jgi:tetrahydromethanopterin S-methyltransferase subunit G
MNGEDAKELAKKLDEIARQLNEAIGHSIKDVGQVKLEMAALRAEVTTRVEQHAREIGILFEKSTALGERVRTVEIRYVPEDFCAAQRKEAHDERKEFRDAISEQRSLSGKILGAAIVVALLAGTLVSWLLQKFGN